MTNSDEQKKTTAKRFNGVVVSDKMTDSAVVRVERYEKHPKYDKYIQHRKRYTAHNPGNKHTVGEKVVIEETNPISKTKRYAIVENA